MIVNRRDETSNAANTQKIYKAGHTKIPSIKF
jgi:hypothetical protein